MEVSIFGCEVRRRNVFAYISDTDIDIRICNDYVRDYYRQDDKKKCYRRFQLFWKQQDFKSRRLYKCDSTGTDSALLQCYRRLGRKISCGIYKGQCGRTCGRRVFWQFHRRYKGGFLLVCNICPCNLCGNTWRCGTGN